jgi:hypothetical protein
MLAWVAAMTVRFITAIPPAGPFLPSIAERPVALVAPAAGAGAGAAPPSPGLVGPGEVPVLPQWAVRGGLGIFQIFYVRVPNGLLTYWVSGI